MFQTLAEILKETKPGPLSPSWCMSTCLSFQRSVSITSQPWKTPELGRKGPTTHLCMPGESTLPVLDEDQLLEVALIVCLA